MCGIFAMLSSKKIEKPREKLIMGLKTLESRGYDSAGYCVANKTSMYCDKSISNTSPLNELCENINVKQEIFCDEENIYAGLGHNRWATNGGVTIENTHPHFSCCQRIAVVHNGIINNHDSLRKFLQSKGHIFTSQTDTEVVAHLIEEKLLSDPTNLENALQESLNMLSGAFALVVLVLPNVDSEETEPTMFATVKNMPLLISKNKCGDQVMIASEAVAFSVQFEMNEYYSLDNESIIVFVKNPLNKYILEYKFLKGQFQNNNQTYYISSLFSNYLDTVHDTEIEQNYHMLQEILEQASVFQNTYQSLTNLPQTIIDPYEKKQARVALIGSGSSMHACEFAMAAAKQYIYVPTTYSLYPLLNVLDASIIQFQDIVCYNTFILVSQSGESSDIIRALQFVQQLSQQKQSKEKIEYVQIFAVVNVPNCSLHRKLFNSTVLSNAGREICVAATKSWLAQSTLLFLTLINNISARFVVNQFTKMQKEFNTFLNPVDILKKTKDFADCLNNFILKKNYVCILGVGSNCFAIAKEAALKIKEVSYVFADNYASASLKHGPLALIEIDVPILLLFDGDTNLIDDFHTCYDEIKSRGANVFSIIPDTFITEFNNHHKPNTENVLIFPDVGLIFAHNLFIGIFCQLISYHLALKRDINPDKPKNLAKSVTVR